MLTIIVFTVKCCQSGQTQAEYQKKWQKLVKNSHFASNQNFDLNFSGYDLLVWRWVQCTQTGSKHHIFICRAENGNSESMYPLKLARSESNQKSLKKAENPKFGLFYTFEWTCMVKIIINFCLEWVLDRFGTKSINKKKISFFPWKSMIFWKKISETLKIHRFGLENPVGWASHVVLAQNQWIRPENGGREKVYPKFVKM